MQKILLILFITLLLSSCGIFRVHKMDIDQGNVIDADKVNRLHTGMSEAQVRDVMGTPVLVNIFDPEELDYVYTYQPAYHDRAEKQVIVLFKHGRATQVKVCNGPIC